MEGRTYRYMKGKAQYPFGYGLTYGHLELTGAEIQKNGSGADVTVTVHNPGTEPVTETLQIYIRNEKSPYAPLHPAIAPSAGSPFSLARPWRRDLRWTRAPLP